MKSFWRILIVSMSILSVAGCVHVRCSCFVSVDGDGGRVVTKNRYTLVVEKFESRNPNSDIIRQNLQSEHYVNEFMKRFQPDVFADNGIQVLFRMAPPEDVRVDTNHMLFISSLSLLPILSGMDNFHRNTIEVLDNPDAQATFGHHTKSESAISLTVPSAFLFYNGAPEPPRNMAKSFVATKHGRGSVLFGGYDSDVYIDANYEAMAYAIAVKLKEMEDKGLVEVSSVKRPVQSVSSIVSLGDKFELENFSKEEGCEYRYVFLLKRRGGGCVSFGESREIRKLLRSMIRDDYVASFPDAAKSVVIDFPEYSLRNGILCGKAIALTLAVESLRYDSNRRTGTMRVRIGDNQLEEARGYLRKNIRSLARDKNIALDGCEIPPAAKVYLENEKLENGVLEITFKTE